MSPIKAIQNPHISHRLSHTIPIFGPCMSHINSFGKGGSNDLVTFSPLHVGSIIEDFVRLLHTSYGVKLV